MMNLWIKNFFGGRIIRKDQQDYSEIANSRIMPSITCSQLNPNLDDDDSSSSSEEEIPNIFNSSMSIRRPAAMPSTSESDDGDDDDDQEVQQFNQRASPILQPTVTKSAKRLAPDSRRSANLKSLSYISLHIKIWIAKVFDTKVFWVARKTPKPWRVGFGTKVFP